MLLNHPITLEELVTKVIISFEGFSSKAFYDKLGKRWTIGYGHARNVTNDQHIDREQAEALLLADCHTLFLLVKDRPMLEAAMLVDFGYNCGETALRRLLRGEVTFQDYGRIAGGHYVDGLIKRRNFEEVMVRLSRTMEGTIKT